jgi:hypothetical protein
MTAMMTRRNEMQTEQRRSRCICGHVAETHGDRGKGACEGYLTSFDGPGINGVIPCGCHTYREQLRALPEGAALIFPAPPRENWP